MKASSTTSRSRESDTRAERPFAVDRRGTTIQAGDVVLHHGQVRRVVSVESASSDVKLTDAIGATSTASTAELQLVV